MPRVNVIRLVPVALLIAAGIFVAMHPADVKMLIYQTGVDYHSSKILETRLVVRQKADELMYRLNNDPAAMEQTLRKKLLRQFIVACEQIPPFDQPRSDYCRQNTKVYRHYGCIRKVWLKELSDQELFDFLADKFQTNILVNGDFKRAMDERIKDLYHVYKYYQYKSVADPCEDARVQYRLTHRLMKEVYAKEKAWLKEYYARSITMDEYKKRVVDLKISTMKQTPEWALGKWKSYEVPKD